MWENIKSRLVLLKEKKLFVWNKNLKQTNINKRTMAAFSCKENGFIKKKRRPTTGTASSLRSFMVKRIQQQFGMLKNKEEHELILIKNNCVLSTIRVLYINPLLYLFYDAA